MNEAAVAPQARAQKLATTASTVATIAAIIIGIAAVTDTLAAPALEALARTEARWDWASVGDLVRAILMHLILALPSFLMAGALYELAHVLNAYAEGRFFTLDASKALRKAGESALWAMAFKIVASPTIHSWVSQESRGFIWTFESFDLGLIAFAAAVMVLGRVLEAATAIKAENDEIV